MSDDIKKEIERKWDTSEDDLYCEIGQALFGQGAFPLQRAKALKDGKEWLKSRPPELAKVLCQNAKVRALCSENPSTSDKIELAKIIADAIMSVALGAPVPIANVCILLAKMGLRSLCGDGWAPEG